MCHDCVKQQLPDRGTMCLESGSYLWNFQGCKACGKKDQIKIYDKQSHEDDDGEELITYKHECMHCGHLIAEHEYTFRVDGDYQEYSMDCVLCGSGADHRSIAPNSQSQCNGTT